MILFSKNGKVACSGLLAGFILSLFVGAQNLRAAEEDKWKIICQQKNDPQSCHIEQRLFLNKSIDGNDKNVGQILSVSVFYTGAEERRPFIVMQLPLGVDLQAGMVLQIDQSPEMKAPFSKCTKAGCEVQSLLTEALLTDLKKGNTLKVGFRPFGISRTMVVKADLNGFTRAFSWLD